MISDKPTDSSMGLLPGKPDNLCRMADAVELLAIACCAGADSEWRKRLRDSGLVYGSLKHLRVKADARLPSSLPKPAVQGSFRALGGRNRFNFGAGAVVGRIIVVLNLGAL